MIKEVDQIDAGRPQNASSAFTIVQIESTVIQAHLLDSQLRQLAYSSNQKALLYPLTLFKIQITRIALDPFPLTLAHFVGLASPVTWLLPQVSFPDLNGVLPDSLSPLASIGGVDDPWGFNPHL